MARRLGTVSGFYRYAEEEGLIGRSPAVHGRRPRLDYEASPSAWTATSLASSSSPPGSARPEHALVSLMAINGRRVSEACGANIVRVVASTSADR